MLVAVLVALVLLVADAGARVLVQNRAAGRIAEALEPRGLRDVHVTVGGWPVLPALVTGRVGEVRISATAPFSLLDERLADSAGFAKVQARHWSAQDGLLVLSAELERGGGPMPVTVALAVDVDGGDLVVTPQSVGIAGIQLPVARVARLVPAAADLLGEHRIAPGGLLGGAEGGGTGGDAAGDAAGGGDSGGGLPGDASLTDVTVDDDGLTVTLVARGP